MINWLKKNWLSVIAVILSVVAISYAHFKIEPMHLSIDRYSFMLDALALLVTILIGWQIYNVIAIDTKIKNEIEKAKTEINKYITEQKNKNLYSINMVHEIIQARIDLLENQYDDALFSYIGAIEAAKNAGFPSVEKACLDAIIDVIIPYIKKEEINITLLKEKKGQYINVLKEVNDTRAFDVIVYLRNL